MQNIIAKHNFIFRQVREMPDVDGKLWEMEHAKTGAKLAWLERDDENMTFAIGFKTIPTDSTGVFHILEHSVLCGSDKYPVKEPFVELLKSSMQTFLNAMTFNDKTVYPVSSRNKQDFLNLVNVYMDAVLHPTAVTKSEIFRQEGWRYEMGEDGKPFFQGVVYNEMKGAYADVRDVMGEAMDQRLFPDNCYSCDSGGNPECIPDLTYEQFCEAHSKYYHPSNSLIFLDGSVDLDSVLPLLDSYLVAYERQTLEFPIPMQAVLPYQEAEVEYEIGESEETKGRTIVSYGRIFATYADQEEIFAAAILADYLAGGSEGPLKRAVLDAGLGTDVKVGSHDGIQQAWMNWQVWNTDVEKVPEIKAFIRKTLTEMVEKGLDRERLTACCANFAFRQMDRDGMGWPRGLVEMLTVYESWLYGGDPAQNFGFRAVLDSLNEKIATGYFEEKIREWLLDDTTGVLVIMKPSQTLGAAKLEREKKRVDSEWEAMSEDEKKATDELCKKIRLWQQTPDSEEALASIPVLKVSDIPETVKKLSVAVENVKDVPVLRHTTGSKLVTLNLLFSANDLTAEELPVASLLGSMLGKLPTAKHDSASLQTVVKQKIGKISFGTEVYPVMDCLDKCIVNMGANAVCLESYKDEAADLIIEMMTTTIFENKSLLMDILRQQKTNLQMSLISGGNRYAIGRVNARTSAYGAASEYLHGCEYISWVNKCCEYDDAALTELLNKMEALAKKVFCRERLTISVSDNVGAALTEKLATVFDGGEAAPKTASYDVLPACREGILIPAGVGFAVKGAHLKNYGKEYTGSVAVLAKMLGLEYLWNAIRVQGGAYGAGFSGTGYGEMLYHTYRDPNPGRSLGCFDESAQVIRDYCKNGGQLDKFILGAVSASDLPLSADGKISLAEARYFKGITHEEVEKTHRELLHTGYDEIYALCDTLEEIAKSENICVVGGQPQLDGCGEKLAEIRQILA